MEVPVKRPSCRWFGLVLQFSTIQNLQYIRCERDIYIRSITQGRHAFQNVETKRVVLGCRNQATQRKRRLLVKTDGFSWQVLPNSSKGNLSKRIDQRFKRGIFLTIHRLAVRGEHIGPEINTVNILPVVNRFEGFLSRPRQYRFGSVSQYALFVLSTLTSDFVCIAPRKWIPSCRM